MTVLDHRIQRLTPSDLKSASYARLAERLFGTDRETHVQYCEWLYVKNPTANAKEPLSLYLFREAGTPIGQLGVVPVDLQLPKTGLRAGWCVDFFVLPTHERRGVGSKLLAAAQADFPVLMTLGQTDASRALFRKHGWCDGPRLTRCLRMLRPVRCLSKRLLQKVGLSAVGRALYSEGRRAVALSPTAIRVDGVSSFADLGGCGRNFEFGGDRALRVRRTPEFMQWRYFEAPKYSYQVRRLQCDAYGTAYAVLRRMEDPFWCRATLVDLLYPESFPDVMISAVVDTVLGCASADGAELCECQTNDEAVIAKFSESLFSRKEDGPRFLFSPGALSLSSALRNQPWRLYAGDCDVDVFNARRSDR